MYPSEINSERFRNVGSSIAMITNWVGVYIVVLITPIGKPFLITMQRSVLITIFSHREHRMEVLCNLCRAEHRVGTIYMVLLCRDGRIVPR